MAHRGLACFLLSLPWGWGMVHSKNNSAGNIKYAGNQTNWKHGKYCTLTIFFCFLNGTVLSFWTFSLVCIQVSVLSPLGCHCASASSSSTDVVSVRTVKLSCGVCEPPYVLREPVDFTRKPWISQASLWDLLEHRRQLGMVHVTGRAKRSHNVTEPDLPYVRPCQ